MSRAIGHMRWLGIDIIHTARTFNAYRDMFFRGQDESELLRSLAGKRVVDVACGYTPYAPDSMFRACEAAGVEFYGVDPALTQPLVPSLKNRAMSRWTGGSGQFLRSPPGIERALGVHAQAMPFDDDSIDHILCAYLLWVWLEDEESLGQVFTEMHRVLKPGGSVRIFPLPRWRSLPVRSADLSSALEQFEISQRFVMGSYRSRTMSAMLTTLVKR